MWGNLSKYFSIKHPDIIKENLGSMVRPLDTLGLPSFMTVGNLWHHYEHFLTEDRDCSPGLKKCFERMEQDEKELVKIERMKEDSGIARDKFVRKTIKKVKQMSPGKSRLFLLQRSMSQDQSLSGDLFCTVSRREDGSYTVNFLGSAARMRELSGGEDPLPVAGKEKTLRNLTFDIDAETFEESPFLETLITGWAKPQDVKSQ